MLDLKAKLALVTGASSGIGAALSLELASLGTNLILTGTNQSRLNAIADKCKAKGVNVFTATADMANFNSIDNFVNYINTSNLKPDLIILNAGISQRAKALETNFEVDQMLMQINYFGPIYLIKKLKDIICSSTHLSIAVTTSIAGLFGFPLRSAYCSSKRALFGFFETLEHENSNINVTFLIPGRIKTPISRNAITGNGKPYDKSDPGQAGGMEVEKCAKIAVKAIRKKKKKKLIGGKELLMAYFYKFIPPLYYKLARKISAT